MDQEQEFVVGLVSSSVIKYVAEEETHGLDACVLERKTARSRDSDT